MPIMAFWIDTFSIEVTTTSKGRSDNNQAITGVKRAKNRLISCPFANDLYEVIILIFRCVDNKTETDADQHWFV